MPKQMFARLSATCSQDGVCPSALSRVSECNVRLSTVVGSSRHSSVASLSVSGCLSFAAGCGGFGPSWASRESHTAPASPPSSRRAPAKASTRSQRTQKRCTRPSPGRGPPMATWPTESAAWSLVTCRHIACRLPNVSPRLLNAMVSTASHARPARPSPHSGSVPPDSAPPSTRRMVTLVRLIAEGESTAKATRARHSTRELSRTQQSASSACSARKVMCPGNCAGHRAVRYGEDPQLAPPGTSAAGMSRAPR
mmetsp:Transcript_12894/g.35698  ORF Transcript_12894/g.35698 Transcript_12894/m.35698 type:complete len:253 (-) Transcript_12894:185-943(-)